MNIIATKEIEFIKKTLQKTNLNLKGYTVLTELGNNYYFYLPFIAALAGAKKVMAWTASNKHFDCDTNLIHAKKVAKKLRLDSVIEFCKNERPLQHISAADIITNSGFLRPLDSLFLENVNKNVVIPLMFEAWELRATDIDIDYCKKKNIRVVGTWESHPKFKIFESVGPLAVKLAFEAGMEVYQNSILVWSDDDFGTMSATYFKKMGAKEVVLTTDKSTALAFMKKADFVYFCANHEKKYLISNTIKDALFTTDEIKEANPTLTIVHLYGKIDAVHIKKSNLSIYPPYDGKAEYMSKTLSHIGMIPTLNLFIASLKVAQEVAQNKTTKLSQIIV